MEIRVVTCIFAGILLVSPIVGGQAAQKPPVEPAAEQGYLTAADGVDLFHRKFNILNTPNFVFPGASLGTAAFGVISSAAPSVTPHQFQFALKVRF